MEQSWQLLFDTKKLDDAAAAYRKAVEINDRFAIAWNNLGYVLLTQKKLDEALIAYRNAVKSDNQYPYGWYGLGKTLLDQGKPKAAIPAFRQAIGLDKSFAQSHIGLGHALRDQGDFSGAVSALQGAVSRLPTFHSLQLSAAREILACLRLQALKKKLALVLKGQEASATVQLELAELFRHYLKRYLDAVTLYASAFAAEPKLATEVRRYDAACLAVLASGITNGANGQQPGSQSKLRQQALAWLQANLQAWEKELIRKPQSAVTIRQHLQRAQNDPNLSGVRAAKRLDALPAPERTVWRKFWSGVEALRKRARACYSETLLKGSLTDTERERQPEVILSAGKLYIIDMQSKWFDTFLRLHDGNGQIIAENDDIDAKSKIQNSRINFIPIQDAKYRVIATSHMQTGRGPYQIIIRVFAGKQ